MLYATLLYISAGLGVFRSPYEGLGLDLRLRIEGMGLYCRGLNNPILFLWVPEYSYSIMGPKTLF